MDQLTALIFDIKKFAIHDGPGIRTTVFFKGCPLACWWCHNPEAMLHKRELVFFEGKCISCGECFEVCPEQAHEQLPDGSRVYHRDKCLLCGKCADVCYAEALVMEGREVTVDELMVELRKDAPFYENSNGGITLSGGEPTRQHEFALALLKKCKAEGFHTAVDTAGQTPWRILAGILPYVDLVLFDIKHIDETDHKKHTGVPNRLILENLAKIGDSGTDIEIRMPIIPGINDAEEIIGRTAEYLIDIKGITRIELLPYHKLGESKWSRLDREYKLRDLEPPGSEHMGALAEVIRSYGMEVHVGS